MCYTDYRRDSHAEQSDNYITVEADNCTYTFIKYKTYEI